MKKSHSRQVRRLRCQIFVIWHKLVSCFIALAAFGHIVIGATVTTNLSPVADTSIFERFPDNNFGGNTDMPAGTTRDGNRGRALLKFDLSSIPSNSKIISVTLKLQVIKAPSTHVASVFGLHPMSRDWGEGTNSNQIGSPATASEATWKARFYPASLWSNGGDLLELILRTLLVRR
jgi:hypothetical protein